MAKTALIERPEVNAYLGGMITALDIQYPLGDGHPLLGRRIPDLDLKTLAGDQRLYSLLHQARPILLDLGDNPELATALTGWRDRVDLVAAHSADERVTVPAAGEIAVPAACLIRPDGYVAWTAGDGTDIASLRDALTTWFGPSTG